VFKCTCKKTIIIAEDPVVDFGEVIYGESVTKKLILKNNGALSTQYTIRYPSGLTFILFIYFYELFYFSMNLT
jgi:hypothetical protein